MAFAVAAHQRIDRVAGNTDRTIGSLHNASKFLHMAGHEVGNQIAELIDVDDFPHQCMDSQVGFEIVKVL